MHRSRVHLDHSMKGVQKELCKQQTETDKNECECLKEHIKHTNVNDKKHTTLEGPRTLGR